MTVRACVVRAAGTNCDQETVAALEAAGAEATLIHINALSREPSRLADHHILIFAGGFTFGDDVASGAVLAYALEQRLYPDLQRFVQSGRAVMGICNGFQILTRLGFLPGAGGRASLLPNLSGRFEDRWVRLGAGRRADLWFEPGQDYWMPVAHAEGRFEWFPEVAGADFPSDQIAVRYRSPDPGRGEAAYPDNPNGSYLDIAGVINADGNVLGLMPHPERFIRPAHHPHWMHWRDATGRPATEDTLPVRPGLDVFRRVVKGMR